MPPARFLEVLRRRPRRRRRRGEAATGKATAMQRGSADRGAGHGRARRRRSGRSTPCGIRSKAAGATCRRCPSTGTTRGRSSGPATGNDGARKRALFTLDQQRKIIDPVWGGICQYSTDGDWLHPHYEKLAAYQAGAIDNYATAFALTGDAQWLRTAQLVRGFVDRFMTSPEGGFYATMDADLNAHDPGKAVRLGPRVLRQGRRRAPRARNPARRHARVRPRERARHRRVRHARDGRRTTRPRSPRRSAQRRASWRRTRRAAEGSPTPHRTTCACSTSPTTRRSGSRSRDSTRRRANPRTSRAPGDRRASSLRELQDPGRRLFRVHARPDRRRRARGAPQALRGQRDGRTLPRAPLPRRAERRLPRPPSAARSPVVGYARSNRGPRPHGGRSAARPRRDEVPALERSAGGLAAVTGVRAGGVLRSGPRRRRVGWRPRPAPAFRRCIDRGGLRPRRSRVSMPRRGVGPRVHRRRIRRPAHAFRRPRCPTGR